MINHVEIESEQGIKITSDYLNNTKGIKEIELEYGPKLKNGERSYFAKVAYHVNKDESIELVDWLVYDVYEDTCFLMYHRENTSQYIQDQLQEKVEDQHAYNSKE